MGEEHIKQTRIEIGTGIQTADEFCQAITEAGGIVNDWAKEIMGGRDFTKSVSSTFARLDLRIATTNEILGREGTLAEVYAGITLNMRGEIIPAEVGPQLRLQHLKQPRNEMLIMAMGPIKRYDGVPSLFKVANEDDILCLSGYYANPAGTWVSYCPWVFI
ncbi:hypothetical protein KAJ89_05490 [Candidatus Parcubacteria bacterium]|nr:hypothetical protein [Candidatus Parcubacteria bacterium]